MDNKILQKALDLQERGVPVPEILNKFPEHVYELREFFNVIRIVAGQKNHIQPSPELARKILMQMRDQRQVERFKSPFASFADSVLNIQWKVWASVGVAVFIVAVFVTARFAGHGPATEVVLNDISRSGEKPAPSGAGDGVEVKQTDGIIRDSALESTAISAPEDALNQSAIEQEERLVDLGAEFDSYFAEEIELSEVDDVLKEL